MKPLFNSGKSNHWSPLFIRLIVGYGFIVHGMAKLSRGPAGGFEKLLQLIGVPFPHITAWIVTFVELLGGIAILTGTLVAFISVPLIVIMLVAMFTIHIKYGFSSIHTIGLTPIGPKFGPPGFEVNLLYIGGLLSLVFSGAGKFSIDFIINNFRSPKKTH